MSPACRERLYRAAGAGALLLALAAAFLLAALLAGPAAAYAQDAPPQQDGPSFPGAGDIANAILSGLGKVLLDTLEQGWPRMIGLAGDSLGRLAEALLRGVWDALARLFGPINVFTQLPDLCGSLAHSRISVR